MYGLPDNAVVGAGKRVRGMVKEAKKPSKTKAEDAIITLPALVLYAVAGFGLLISPLFGKLVWSKERKEIYKKTGVDAWAKKKK